MPPNEATISPARPSDLDALLQLERSIQFAPHWPRETYAAILESVSASPQLQPAATPIRSLFVACAEQQQLIGFAAGIVFPAAISPQAELETVAVAASSRRTGIGRNLCLAVIDWCRSHGASEILLEVRAGSSGAIALYTQLGFVPQRIRPRYYSDPPADALLMRLHIATQGPCR
jgi:ribosomal-protein-alanine N-acetyltransferase